MHSQLVMNKLSMKEHIKKTKSNAFFHAKWPPKSGTLQHGQLISFVLMLNLHRCVQLACNPKTIKINFLSHIIHMVYMFLFLTKFTLKTQQFSITHCVCYMRNEFKHCLLS